MDNYFIPSEYCPKSKDSLLHSTVHTVRCGPCGLLNPQYAESSPKPLERPRAKPIANQEIIEIEESPVAGKSRRQGVATTIPTINNFKLGNSEKERQLVNAQIADRKTKTGFNAFPPQISFAVGFAQFDHDISKDDGGDWVAMNGCFTIHENNRALTSQDLTTSLLLQAQAQALRPSVKAWVFFGKMEDWTLAHTNPTKAPPRDIAPWIQPKILSVMIDAGSYEQKAIVGSPNKLVTIWLYNTPEAPMPSKPLTPPLKLSKKGGKKEKDQKKIKNEGKFKEEKKVKEEGTIKGEEHTENEATRAKRPRPVSGEMSLPKRSGLVTRQQSRQLSKLLEELESPISDDDVEGTSGYSSLLQLVDEAEGSGGEELPV